MYLYLVYLEFLLCSYYLVVVLEYYIYGLCRCFICIIWEYIVSIFICYCCGYYSILTYLDYIYISIPSHLISWIPLALLSNQILSPISIIELLILCIIFHLWLLAFHYYYIRWVIIIIWLIIITIILIYSRRVIVILLIIGIFTIIWIRWTIITTIIIGVISRKRLLVILWYGIFLIF